MTENAGPEVEGFDPEQLRELSDQLIRVVTSPAVVEQVQAVLAAPEDRRLSEAADRLTPTALRGAGVEIPEFARISSRYFEEGRGDEVNFIDVEGSKDVLQVLHGQRPGILDRIRAEDPELWGKLLKRPRGPFPPEDPWGVPDTVGPRAGLCLCVGGGPSWSVCVGGGA